MTRFFAAICLLAAAVSNAAEDRYTVQQGDTLYTIAERQLDNPGAWQTLQKINQVADPVRLKPGSVLSIPAHLAAGTAQQAEAVWVRGEALRLRGTQQVPLTQGEILAMGDVVTTSAQSSVTLRFADGSRLMLGPQGRLHLTRMTKARKGERVSTGMTLETGTLESVVQKSEGVDARYEVKTPSLNLAVRGTKFRVIVDSATGMTSSTVSEGAVLASAQGQQVALAAGQGTFAAKGAGPAPARALIAPPTFAETPARAEIQPLRFAWAALEGAQNYRIELLDASGEQTHDQLLTTTPQARWAGLADGNYQLRARAIDAAGMEGQPAVLNFALDAQPAPPLLRFPVGDVVVEGERVAFRWTRPGGAQWVRLQVADSPDFARIVSQVRQLPGSVGGIEIALPPGRYYWRTAVATQQGGWGPDSALGSFELKAGSGIAQPPADRQTLVWRPGRPGQRVHLQAASDPQFLTMVHEVTQAEVQTHFAADGNLHVRLRRLDEDGLATPFDTPQFLPALDKR